MVRGVSLKSNVGRIDVSPIRKKGMDSGRKGSDEGSPKKEGMKRNGSEVSIKSGFMLVVPKKGHHAHHAHHSHSKDN